MYRLLSGLVSCLVLLAVAARGDDGPPGGAAGPAPATDAAISQADAVDQVNEPTSASGGRCRGIRSIKGTCRESLFRGIVRFRGDLWDGRVVTIGVVGGPRFDVTVRGKKAKMLTCCYHGFQEVVLLDPDRCLDPVMVTCPD